MGTQYDTIYGVGTSGSPNIVQYETINTHTNVEHLSGAVDLLNTITRTASGDIELGSCVILNADGTASQGGKIPDNITGDTSSNIGIYSLFTVDTLNNKWVQAYGSGSATYRTVSVSGDSITYGQNSTAHTDTGTHTINLDYDPDTDQFIGTWYKSFLGSHSCYTVVGEVVPHATDPSQDSITLGSNQILHSGAEISEAYYARGCKDTANNYYHLFLGRTSPSQTRDGVIRSYTVGSLTLSSQYNTTIASDDATVYSLRYSPTEDRLVGLYSTGGSTYSVVVSAGSASASVGTPQALTYTPFAMEYDPIRDEMLMLCRSSNTIYVQRGVIASEDVTWTPYVSPVTDVNTSFYHADMTYDSVNDVFLIVYRNTSSQIGIVVYYPADSTFGTPLILYSGTASQSYTSVQNLSGAERSITFAYDGSPSQTETYIVDLNLWNTLTINNFIGIAQNAVSDGGQVIIGRYGFVDQNQTGMTPGTLYYADTDGVLTSVDNGILVGLAVTDTDIIVKG